MACPVSAVSAYMNMRQEGVAFFAHEDGNHVTRYQFSTIFKRCLTKLGICASEYGTHSFRIGAATEAARAGLPNEAVRRIGRWRSDCYAGYIRPELRM